MSVIDSAPVPVGRLGFARHEDVDLFVQRLEAFERGELSPDDWRSFRLLNGVYGQRQDGVMMIRAKLPGRHRDARAARARSPTSPISTAAARATSRRARTCSFTSSRTPRPRPRCAMLADAGITTKEACGHSVRNWTCCPFAGVAADEPFDPTPYVEALARHLLRGPYSSTLPRKLKPSLGGCCGTDCSQAFINDLGFLARKRRGDGDDRLPAARRRRAVDAAPQRARRRGIRAGRRDARGRRRDRPRVPPDRQPPQQGEGAAQVGDRQDRRRRVPRRVPRRARRRSAPRAACRSCCRRNPSPPRAPRAARAGHAAPTPGYAEWAADSVRPQKQTGFSAVVDPADPRRHHRRAAPRASPISPSSSAKARSGSTNEQNLVLRFVPDREAARAAPRARRASASRKSGANSLADVTSCPGASSCKLAVTASRGLARRAHRRCSIAAPISSLRARPRHQGLGLPARLRPALHRRHRLPGRHAQARRQARRRSTSSTSAVASRADRADFGRLIGKVPARRAAATLERLLDFYIAEGAHEPRVLGHASPIDVLRALIADLTELDDADAIAGGLHRSRREPPRSRSRSGEGECSA